MNHLTHVRDARAADVPAMERIIRTVGLFTPEEAAGFVETLQSHFEGSRRSSDPHLWLIADDETGAAYLGPEPSPGVWNLLFLGVLPEARRRGVARALVAEAERRSLARGGRMLLIDTSTSAPMAAARALYPALGYERVAHIPDYWAPGDGKLTFRRSLAARPA